jgi:hypothetical protein
MEGTWVEPTGLVNYQSRCRVAVFGDQSALEIAPRLNDNLSPIVILTQGAEEPGAVMAPVGGRCIQVEGRLGAFKILLGELGRANIDKYLRISEG